VITDKRQAAALLRTLTGADELLRNPITGIAACCARAASGQAAAPPSSVMNSRRFMRSNCIPSPPARAGLQNIELAMVGQGYQGVCTTSQLSQSRSARGSEQ
jgi:hypothetical protein